MNSTRQKGMLIIALSFIILWPSMGLASLLPDTGQTKCYDDGGNEITPCPQPGEPFYGQDAQHICNPHSYTKLDASSNDLSCTATEWVMVRDNVTGLIWEVKTDDGSIHDKDNTYTWYDGSSGRPGDGTDTLDFMAALNSAHFGGFSDWRLPTVKELSFLVDRGRYNPLINTTYFPHTVSSYYWSSTTCAGYPYSAWYVNFYSGSVDHYGESSSYGSGYVRAVKVGTQSGSVDNFVDNGDGTVTDTDTGLMWQQGTVSGIYTWEEALSYCENLSLGGHNDWRLPNINELQSLVHYTRYNPSIDTVHFSNTVSSYYWSSTTNAYYPDDALIVCFSGGRLDYYSKSLHYPYYLRAVRGGQCGSLDPSTTTTTSTIGPNCLNFNLLKGRHQQPSNIYLFFSVETCGGEPKTGLQEDDFEVYQDGEEETDLISTYESKQTILPSPILYKSANVLLLDMSGSILESETLNPLKSSAKAFVSEIAGENGQEVAIYYFDGRKDIIELSSFTNSVSTLQNAIDSLTKEGIVNNPAYDISTNLNGAVIQGLSKLDEKESSIEEDQLFVGSLVSFTDGTDRAHRYTDAEAVNAVNSSDHYSFVIGLGGELDETHLENLAGRKGLFFTAETADELEAAFIKIAEEIKKESEKFYILGYCSPSRQGSHKVILKVKGYTGNLSYPFNSNGFEGGCDPEDILPTTTTTTAMTTTTTAISPPCTSELIYGEHSQETELLRYIRDTVLSTTPEGQEIIRLYYEWSPAVVKVMEEDAAFKAQVKEMIDGALEVIQAD